MTQKIVPAILTNDVEELRGKFALLKGESEWVHVDIMDGRFVPRVSLPLEALKEFEGQFSFEIHLMVADPANYFDACREIGAERVVWHCEAVQNMDETLKTAERYPFERGVALRPETSESVVERFLPWVDFALLLGVEPGAQGNPFAPEVLEKARLLRGKTIIGVDGGVSVENLRDVFLSGADYAVVGSAIWKSGKPLEVFREMQTMVKSHNE